MRSGNALSLTRGNDGTLMLLFTTEEALSACAECQKDKMESTSSQRSVYDTSVGI